MGLNVYLTRKSWLSYDQGKTYTEQEEDIYDANITHNLNKMAGEAEIYDWLWRPEEHGITTASQLIEPLSVGFEELKSKPEHYAQFNSPNGWGMYDHFVSFVEKYLEACIENPEATITASR